MYTSYYSYFFMHQWRTWPSLVLRRRKFAEPKGGKVLPSRIRRSSSPATVGLCWVTFRQPEIRHATVKLGEALTASRPLCQCKLRCSEGCCGGTTIRSTRRYDGIMGQVDVNQLPEFGSLKLTATSDGVVGRCLLKFPHSTLTMEPVYP